MTHYLEEVVTHRDAKATGEIEESKSPING
jgi:hypothetical protein